MTPSPMMSVSKPSLRSYVFVTYLKDSFNNLAPPEMLISFKFRQKLKAQSSTTVGPLIISLLIGEFVNANDLMLSQDSGISTVPIKWPLLKRF